MDGDTVPDAEWLQIQQIRELDFEELEVEEVDVLYESDENDGNEQYNEDGVLFTFDTSLTSLHTYLGGVVLFPWATLPLRVIEPRYVAAVLRALDQVDFGVSDTIAVARCYKDTSDQNRKFSSVGTTAEILQHRLSEDGCLNLVTRGRQRFAVRRHWIDMEGQSYGEVQIMQEDFPSKIPQKLFTKLSSQNNIQIHNNSSDTPSASSSSCDIDGCESKSSFSRTESPSSAFRHCFPYSSSDESTKSEDKSISECEQNLGISDSDSFEFSTLRGLNDDLKISEKSVSNKLCFRGKRWTNPVLGAKFNESRVFSSAFWPYWVYQMHDSYHLAERLARMWKEVVETSKEVVGTPSISSLVKSPDLLSFYVASNIVVSDSKRQELLEIKGISYRLIREIELLQGFDCIRCKNCQSVIAKRSDMLVMSNEGLLSAYVNPGGFVHQMVTFYRATGLAQIGRSSTEYSWFPGYSWTITNCSTCERHVGWVFKGINKMLKPRLFWGIRSSQIADPMAP